MKHLYFFLLTKERLFTFCSKRGWKNYFANCTNEPFLSVNVDISYEQLKMDELTIIALFFVFYFVLVFFDIVFKSCSHYPYINFLKETGLEVAILRISWSTTFLNRSIQKWGICRPRFLQAWFSLGTAVAVCLLPVSVWLVVKMIYNALQFNASSSESPSPMVLEPLIPGVNLPLNEIGYYITTLLVCTFIHEIGHAVAAVREDVHIIGMGFFLFIILPAACVYFKKEQLASLSPGRRLRILCAGIWHNIFLAIVTTVFLIIFPWILSPFFFTGSGVYVINISPDSSVFGPSGLQRGDIVTSLNNCVVTDSTTWRKCLLSALRNPSPGYCTTAEFVRDNDESVHELSVTSGGVECCTEEAAALGRLCFQLIDDSGGPVELPEHSCLPTRTLIESSKGLCAFGHSSCAVDLHCLRPSLANSTKLVSIQKTIGKVVLFLGNPAEVYQTVEITNFVPQWDILNPVFPHSFEILLKYLTTISAGLAVINILPCFFFDGQHIISALCDLVLSRHIKDKNMRSAVSLCATVFGSVLLLAAMIAPLYREFLR